MQATHDATALLSVDDARDTILGAFAPLPAVLVPIDQALGMVLAEDIQSAVAVPPFANSAMDGFAVVSADSQAATPSHRLQLRVIGEAPAGSLCSTSVVSGSSVRIMTGAPIPAGADAVIRFEDVEQVPSNQNGAHGPDILLNRPVRHLENIRPAGEDVRIGDVVLSAETVMRPAELGMLANLGRAAVSVHRRPRVAVLATGDELVNPGNALGPGQIYNSNTSTVAALIRRIGSEPVILGIARDNGDELRKKLFESGSVDLVITTGGVSVGDYDLVKQVLRREGVIDLWQVRIKPGKPLAFGHLGTVPLIGLPGNPVAATVAFEQFARPAIQRMLGCRNPSIPSVRARLLDRIENRGGRRNFVRARTWRDDNGYITQIAGRQGSAIMTALVNGNSLVVIPEDCQVAEPGMVVEAQMLDWVIN